jgi:hypothetical protein
MKILVKTAAALLAIRAYSSGGGMMAQSGPAKNVVLEGDRRSGCRAG